MRAVIFRQVPHANAAVAVAADDFALVRVNDDVVGGAAVAVATLNLAGTRLPDLDGAVLRACDHPFSFAVKGDACDVPGVTLKGQEGVRVGRLDVEELDRVVAGGSEEALVGRYAETVDLRVGVLDRARADAGKCFPEPVMSVSRRS